jgi:hypothetical protein
VGLPPRIDPWRRAADLATPIALWGKAMRLAATLGDPSFLQGRLVLHKVADFFLHTNGWRRVETQTAVWWQGPHHLPPVWRVGKRHRDGWVVHPSLWTGDGGGTQWAEGQAALIEQLDDLRVVGTREACVEGTVLPWWMLPACPLEDGPSTQRALAQVHTAAKAATVHLHDHKDAAWWRLTPPLAVDGVPLWPDKPCRLAATEDGRSFADLGDRVQAGAVAAPVLSALWRGNTPCALDRLALPGCTTQSDALWTWELPTAPPSAHQWIARTGVWRAAAARTSGTPPGTPTSAPLDTAPGKVEALGSAEGTKGPRGRLEQRLAALVREGHIVAQQGRLLVAKPLDCDTSWNTPDGGKVWAWTGETGCAGLVGWTTPEHPGTWRAHPEPLFFPKPTAPLDLPALQQHARTLDVVVDRADLRSGALLPWWALGAEDPTLPTHARLFWEQVALAVQAFLLQEGAAQVSVLLCPPHQAGQRLAWPQPLLRWEGTAGTAFAPRFQRILLPLVEQAFQRPTCKLLPGHVARAVWRMVANPTPFPTPIRHPDSDHSAHHAMAMAAAWRDLAGGCA